MDMFRVARVAIVESGDAVSAGDDRDGAVGNERDAVAAHAGADAHFDLGEPAHVVRVADVENRHAEGPHDERGSMVGDDRASLLVDDARIDVRDLFRMGRIGIVENVDAVTAGDERDGAVGKKRDARCELAGALDFDLGEAATSFGSSTHTPYCPTTSAVLLSMIVSCGRGRRV